MLDLQKYLKKGEDLSFKLKCHEKLVFEVEPDLSEDALSGVAGGSPGPNDALVPFDEDLFLGDNPAIHNVTFRLPSPVPGSEGSIAYTDVIEPGPSPLSFPNRLGARHHFRLVRGQDGNIYIRQ